jgi:hypothetical protein
MEGTMLISELIQKLEEKKQLHGDLPVYHWDDWESFSVEEVNFIEAYEETGEYGYHEPAHILLGKTVHGFGTPLCSLHQPWTEPLQ